MMLLELLVYIHTKRSLLCLVKARFLMVLKRKC